MLLYNNTICVRARATVSQSIISTSFVFKCIKYFTLGYLIGQTSIILYAFLKQLFILFHIKARSRL